MASIVPIIRSKDAASPAASRDFSDVDLLLLRGWACLPREYAIPAVAPPLEEAQSCCRRLATSHYENFSVATWFLPKHLHQHFFNIYAYCRIADDLGDEEVGGAQVALALLDCSGAGTGCNDSFLEGRSAANAARHPVFVALAETIRSFAIPRHEFSDLLVAFRQDQSVSRYETFDDLLGYCKP